MTTLDERLDALGRARAAGEGRLPAALAAEADAVISRAGERRRRSPDYTVVGLFGATGSGKSSLINALVGDTIARTHVRRPTTSEALAAIWGPDEAVELLDWLGVRQRVVRDEKLDARAAKLILLDLPDFDSIEVGNRAIAEKLAAQVDALVWVVDPQKYADAVLHAQFITPHARHGAVTLIVLNQIDLLTPTEQQQVIASLREIVTRDGIPRARVLPVSASTGEGVAALRAAIGDLAGEKALTESRLTADVRTIAERMPAAGSARVPGAKAAAALSDSVAVAAGADLVARAVAASYRKRSGQATGWPLTAWLLRLRPDPLARLGLGPSRRGADPAVHRTSMPALNAGAQAKVSLAVRQFADAAAEGLTDTWRAGIRSTAEEGLASLPPKLDLAIASTPIPARGSWWWVIIGIVQWLVLLAGLVGVGWLLAAALLPTWGLPRIEVPTVEGWAVPTLLIVGAVLAGILLGLLSAALGAAAAASRRRRARKALVASIRAVVQTEVVGPVTAQVERAREYAASVAVAAAG